jgi:hypothetical protein
MTNDTLERELAAMTASVERVRAERDTIARQGEHDRIAAISYQNELAAMTAELELAKRQVAIVSKLACEVPCHKCPALAQCTDNRRVGIACRETMAA